jgi:regulator of protease activity HflC (stomatin/prohibitin superfamily)
VHLTLKTEQVKNKMKLNFLTDDEGIFTAKRLSAAVVILLFFFFVVLGSIISVKAGTVAILMQGGKPVGVFEPGFHLKWPFIQSLELMDMTIQKVESVESAGTNDLQTVSATVALNYRLNPSTVIDVFNDFHHDYAVRVIKPAIEESLKASTAHYSAAELIQQRELVKDDLDDVLSDRIENIEGKQYFIFVQASLTDFAFNPQFQAQVEAKVEQVEKALEAQNKLVEVEAVAQQKVIQAEAQKAADIAKAEGYALAHILDANATAWGIERMADAKAYEIQMINEKIADNPGFLQYTWMKEWNGVLPSTVFGDENIELLLQGFLGEP